MASNSTSFDIKTAENIHETANADGSGVTKHVLENIKATVLPEVERKVKESGYTPEQIKVLKALVDTVIPMLSDEETKQLSASHLARLQRAGVNIQKEGPSLADIYAFAKLKSTDMLVENDIILRLTDGTSVCPDNLRNILLAIYLLTTGIGTTIITTGAVLKNVPFYELSREDREKVLNSWFQSPLDLLRQLAKSVKSLTSVSCFGKNLVLEGNIPQSSDNPNPVWKAIQYPGFPDEKPVPPKETAWTPRFENVEELASRAGTGRNITLTTDVVIIGSGAGGGVVAAELAQAGYRVLVLEKAPYRHHTDLTMNELDSVSTLYERGGALQSENGGIQILAAKAWGGGTFVNWSASLIPPGDVRTEWSEKYNLPHFTSKAFQKSIDTVTARLGVSDAHLNHNIPNQTLMDGCAKLGYHAAAIPQNTAGKEHACGFCTFGCPYAEKQSSNLTWLHDAQNAGAKFIAGCHVDRVTYTSSKTVSGIVGTVLDGTVKIVVSARRVVVCCGGINSPALLLRSGLKNSNIGRHLRLHPVSIIHGFMPGTNVKPHSGAIMTSVSNAVANVNGDGYGARLEVVISHPGLNATVLPWRSGLDFKRMMLQFPRTVNILALCRDLDSVGRVWIDSKGDARIDFQIGKKDAFALQEAIVTATKVLLIQGAVEVNTGQIGLRSLQLDTLPSKTAAECLSDPINSDPVQKFIKDVRQFGIVQNKIGIFSAHQMGSCRMGSTPSMGAVNPQGETWDVKGLYVADASVFPTASGVNPMITTYSVAYSIAQFMKRDLGASVGENLNAKL